MLEIAPFLAYSYSPIFIGSSSDSYLEIYPILVYGLIFIGLLLNLIIAGVITPGIPGSIGGGAMGTGSTGVASFGGGSMKILPSFLSPRLAGSLLPKSSALKSF